VSEGRILVVDDEPEMVENCTRLLRRAGATVTRVGGCCGLAGGCRGVGGGWRG